MFVTIAAAIVAGSGLWLWFLGDTIVDGAVLGNDPFVLERWIRRLHWGAAVGLALIILFMLVRSVVWKQELRALLLLAFLIFVGVGFWAGFAADWAAARLWSETVGSKLSAGISLGERRPSLPPSLREARIHLSVVPAALLIVAVASLLNNGRR